MILHRYKKITIFRASHCPGYPHLGIFQSKCPFKNMPMAIIFHLQSEIIYRKCYFHKLSAFKMKPK